MSRLTIRSKGATATPPRGRRRAVAALSLLAGGAAACTAPSPPGETMMVLRTDLSLPKDVDSVTVQVLVRGDTRFDETFEKLGAQDSLKIPASLGVTIDKGNDPTTPFTVRVTASAQGAPHVLREVITTVAPDRIAELGVPIQWLCWDQVSVDSQGNAQATCPSGQTCIAGTCADETVPVSSLGTYSAGSVFGGGTGSGDGSCFDVAACFTGSVDAPVDRTACTITASGSVNVGIRVESAGICGPAGCFVVLDADSAGGWQAGSSGTITLPPAVCARLASGAASGVSVAGVSSACPLKNDSLPECGPWSSAGQSPAAPGTVTPVALVAGQDHPAALAVAGGNVYWTSSGSATKPTGAVKLVPIAGGVASTLFGGQAFPKDLALDVRPSGTVAGVYWAANGAGGPGSVLGLDLTTPASPKPVAFSLPKLVSPEGLAVQGGNLFFTDFGGDAVYALSLQSKTAQAIASPANNLPQSSPYRIAADSATLYWTDEAAPGTVMMASQASPTPTVIAKNQGTPRSLVLDSAGAQASAVYWANYNSGEVMRALLKAGSPPIVEAPVAVASKQQRPYGLALDATYVYWTNAAAGTVVKAPKAGGSPVVVASGQASPGAIAVDGENVYWINQGSPTAADGAIMKLAKSAPPPP